MEKLTRLRRRRLAVQADRRDDEQAGRQRSGDDGRAPGVAQAGGRRRLDRSIVPHPAQLAEQIPCGLPPFFRILREACRDDPVECWRYAAGLCPEGCRFMIADRGVDTVDLAPIGTVQIGPAGSFGDLA